MTLRLAYLAPEFFPPWGGVSTYSTNLLRPLSHRKDLEIHVITPRKGEYTQERIEREFDGRITVHTPMKATGTFSYNFVFQGVIRKELPRIIDRYSIDVVHSASLVHMPDLLLKFSKVRPPSVVTGHTTIDGQVSGFLQANKKFLKMAPSEKGSLLFHPYIRAMEAFYLRRTPDLISPSRRFADIFKNEYHYPGRIHVIYYGLDVSVFDPGRVKSPFDVFPQLQGKAPIVMYIGRLVTQKGLDLFVRAMNEFGSHEAHFVIAGSGSPKLLLDLLAQHRVPRERWSFLGQVDNAMLPWLLSAADVFVLPSYYENFPISLMEAMAMARACVSTDGVGAINELIIDGETGLLFKPGDFPALIRAVRRLLEDPTLRQRLGSNALTHVSTELTSERAAEKTFDVYRSLVPG